VTVTDHLLGRDHVLDVDGADVVVDDLGPAARRRTPT
jgi:hypothetical protein